MVGYGGMHLSIDGRPPDDQGVRVVQAALDAGATLIDTADVYCLGSARHRTQRAAHRAGARGLARTPCGRDRRDQGRRGPARRALGERRESGPPPGREQEQSLRALGIERIDLYQLHAPDPRVPLAESVGELARLRDDGKIRWIGLSNVSVAQVREARAVAPITTVQIG